MMKVTSSLVSTRKVASTVTSLPPIVFAFHLLPGQKHANTCGGIFLTALFINAPALPAKEKPEQSTRQRSFMASVTRSSERNIRGCRNKNRPNGTSSVADHGLIFGGAVRLAPGKQMLPGKSWMAPVMVWPLQPVGAFAHKASLKELELVCRETGHRTAMPCKKITMGGSTMATTAENEEFAKSLLPTYPLDEAIEWIQKNMEPEDVFSVNQLEQWAADSGFLYSSD